MWFSICSSLIVITDKGRDHDTGWLGSYRVFAYKCMLLLVNLLLDLPVVYCFTVVLWPGDFVIATFLVLFFLQKLFAAVL